MKLGNLPESILCLNWSNIGYIHVYMYCHILRPFKGPIEREIQREMGTGDKAKEVKRETENRRNTG